jgi:hemerythrin-like domain-containing protein
MCQNCGCLANTLINELTEEHDRVVELIRSAGEHQKAGRGAEAISDCHRISAILAPHTIVEEAGLFRELFDEFPGQLAELIDEHRQIEQVMAEAAEAPDTLLKDPSWPGRLHTALAQLREHILKEQDGIFPAAVIALDGEQWERVQIVRERSRTELRAARS